MQLSYRLLGVGISILMCLFFIYLYKRSENRLHFETSIILFDKDKKPLTPLRSLFEIFNISQRKGLRFIIRETHHAWASDSSKFLVSNVLHSYEKSDKNADKNLKDVFDKLGFIKPSLPDKSINYHSVIVFEATLPVMYERLKYLISLENKGFQLGHIIILTPFKRVEAKEITELKDFLANDKGQSFYPTNSFDFKSLKREQDITKFIWQHLRKPLYFEKRHTVSFKETQIPEPLKPFEMENVGYTLTRIVEEEKLTEPYLGISSLPFISFQRVLLNNIMPTNFDMQIVGPGTYEGSEEQREEILSVLSHWVAFELHLTGKK
jgi:hypothetical protein